MILVNIGLAGNDGSIIPAERALAALYATGAKVLDYKVAQSATEPTLIAELQRALSIGEAYGIASMLHQDCIAQSIGDIGELYGPAADAWRPFNPQYFLTLE